MFSFLLMVISSALQCFWQRLLDH